MCPVEGDLAHHTRPTNQNRADYCHTCQSIPEQDTEPSNCSWVDPEAKPERQHTSSLCINQNLVCEPDHCSEVKLKTLN